MNKIKNEKLTILKILNLNWLNLTSLKNTKYLKEFTAVYKLNNSECNQ